jgi:hypothetical protein
MPFQYSEIYREKYFSAGLTILRGIIPPALLSDLRRETDTAREIARKTSGLQSQRLQPVYQYEELNHQAFRDFLELPDLRATVEGILGAGHKPTDNMGVLLEPAENAWCTNWHRDVAHHIPGLDCDLFFQTAANLQTFNQYNTALYDDHSLWVVPGSHHREDTPQERACFPNTPPDGPELHEKMQPAERERVCLEYTRSMPGAEPVVLFTVPLAGTLATTCLISSVPLCTITFRAKKTAPGGMECAGCVQ